jgi:hypothetical protein
VAAYSHATLAELQACFAGQRRVTVSIG